VRRRASAPSFGQRDPNVTGSPSGSAAVSTPLNALPRCATTFWSWATGRSLTSAMITVIVAALDVALPSDARKVSVGAARVVRRPVDEGSGLRVRDAGVAFRAVRDSSQVSVAVRVLRDETPANAAVLRPRTVPNQSDRRVVKLNRDRHGGFVGVAGSVADLNVKASTSWRPETPYEKAPVAGSVRIAVPWNRRW
jgi:hypothetical protein